MNVKKLKFVQNEHFPLKFPLKIIFKVANPKNRLSSRSTVFFPPSILPPIVIAKEICLQFIEMVFHLKFLWQKIFIFFAPSQGWSSTRGAEATQDFGEEISAGKGPHK